MSISTERRRLGWLAYRAFPPAVDGQRQLSQPHGDLIRAGTRSFIAAAAWNGRCLTDSDNPTAVTHLPAAYQCCTRRTTARTGFEKQRVFSIFPARAELLAVRSLLAQPDLLLVHNLDGSHWRRSVIATRSPTHHT